MKFNLLLLMFTLMAGVAIAGITMTIDTDAETFSFSGSVSLNSASGDEYPVWKSGSAIPSEMISCDGAFSFAGDGESDGSPNVKIGSSEMRVITLWWNNSQSSITGTGTSFSYSGLSSGAKTYLEGLDGAILSDQNGGVSQLEIKVEISSNTAPTVTTQAVSGIAVTTATGNGNVTATGSENITERGIYYSTNDGFADGAGTKVSTTGDWSTTGAFTQAITGLSAGTTYFVKAFAKNSAGTAYGSQVSFTTLGPPTIASFTPLSGAVGATVTITGTNFNTTPANNVVYFGATKATVSASTASSLTVTVPTGATYAPITVLNTGTSLAAYSLTNFSPTFTPNTDHITTEDIAAKVDFATGTGARCVVIGDIDGDGKPDLVVANNGDNTVSVLRNTGNSGSPGFATKVDFAVVTYPQSMAIGDIDGDGKPDLAVANYNSSLVSVFRNTSSSGSISFATKSDFTTGISAKSVAIGDLDGDGKPDLAVGCYSNHVISVLRNTGSSGSLSFASKVDISTVASVNSVAIGDLDGDRKPDLVAGIDWGVSVFRNISSSGSLSFAAREYFSTGQNPWSVVIGDLDGDNKPDLAAANFNSASVSVLRNTSSSGSISFATKADLTTEANPASIAIGDINGDGKPDLAVANYSSASTSLFRNMGSSGSVNFAAKVDFVAGTTPISTAIGDMDGDGKLDLAVANYGDNSVSVLQNTPVLPPTITSFSPLSGAVGATVTITGTNFNTTPANNVVYFGATKATVSASTAGSLTVTVPTGATYAPITVLNTGTSLAAYSQANFNPIFTPSTGHIVAADLASRVNFPTGETPRLAGIGDIDGDGKPDVVTTSYSPREVSVLLNTGSSGTPNFATKVDFSVGGTPMIVSLGDIDGDGKLDLVIGNGSGASVLRNTSTVGSVSFATKVDLTTGSYPISVAIGDLDGDGKPDLAVENYSSNTVSVFRNTGSSGSISFATKVDFATGTRPTDVSIGDLDGDGKLDMVVSNWSSNTVSVFRNTSTSGSINSSSFAAKVDFATATNPRYISIGDLDGDAKLDLTVVNQGSDNISILHNTATSGTINSSSFATKVDYTAGSDPHSAPIGDINGDGKPDLAIGNHGSDNISILRNTSTSGAISFAAKVDIASGDRPYSVSIGDVDGDGKPDLVAANYGDDDISVLLNTPASAPTVTTQVVSDITTITATGNGNVTATGGANIIERGIYYSTSDGFADGVGTKVSTTGDWSTAGAFTQAITGLSSGTTYYVKAYAKNSVGTGYGSQVSFTTPWQPLDNNALEFDGIDDHVEVTTTLSPSFTQGTISFWIKPKATPSNHARVFSDYWNDDEIYLQNGTGKVATYQMINGGDLMSSNPLPNNTWTHVAITMNTTSSQLYINGVLDDESGSSETDISSDYEIGGYSTNYPDSPEVINGYLDEFRIWSVVRTEKEIREYMCRALTGNEDNLIAYYNFDHSSGTVLQDFSGNGNDGILTNMDDADWVDSEAFTTWLGGTSNDWSTASNWTDGVPTSTDNVGVYKWGGNSEATISGTPTVNNMVISSSASPTLGSNITVNGNLILEKNLGLNGKTVTLGSSGTLIEDAGVFSGTSGLITTTRSLSNISSENVAGIGAVITNTSDLGSTTISRGHNTGITSLKRYYQISPTNNPSNATLVFNYHETELNSLSEEGLKLFKSADGNTWSKQTPSVVNTSENTISLTGINSFSYWTGAEEIPTYYMAKSAGNWSITSIWYTNSTGGTDPSTYTTVATTSPTALNSDGIIVNADVTVDTDVSIDQTTVNFGASLSVNNGTTLTIANGTGNDLTITGAITNNGTISPAASTTIVYDGADQTILPLNYSELSFNGSASGSTKTFADGTTMVAQEITIAEAMALTGSAADAVTVQVITPGEGGTTSRVFNINASGETISISNMTIKGGDISGNGDITAGYGGGVYIAAGTVNFDGTEISGSKAYKGGGIYGTDCTVSLSNSLLTNNSASYQAGGLFAILSDASLTECTVSNNTTVHSASGVFANNSNLEVTKCTFNNNSGSTSGNAIYSFVNSGLSGTSVNLTVAESTIANNTGGVSGGGGIAAYGQSSKAIYTVIKNSTISGNSATSSGYGVYFYQNIGTPRSTMEISNSIIVDNSGTDYNYIGYGTLTDGGYNVVENANVAANATGGFNNSTSILYNTMNGDATITNSSWTQGGSDLTNQNLNLASNLADNGGPTQTLALEEGSFAAASAITGIPPASNWNSSPEIDGAYTDQRGVTRTADQNTSIGAYSANYDPCTNPISGGSIGTAQTICYQATPNALTSVSVPTGQTGDLEFKWQSSTTSSSTGFSDIESSNTTGYSPGSLSDTTWFKRLARVDCETDWSGAVESNVVEVAVYDLPVANCQDITVYLDSAGSVSIDSSDINNGSTYGCGLKSMTVDNSEFICSDIGGNTVTLTVTDLSDNTDFCESTVTVSDTIPPTANCQNITVYLDGSGSATIDSLAIDNNSSGNCSLASHVLDISSFDCSNVGANTVVMTVTDVNSNTSACSATVTVSDTIPPTANCQNITVYLDGSGIATIDSLAIDNNSSGNCSLVSHVLDISSFDCSNVGANTVVMTVTDVNSNTSACSATVTVSDTIPPTANCQNITVYLDGSGIATIDSLAIDNNSSGNCSLASHVLDISSFDCSNVGANTVVMTVTDVNSNTSACSATVVVVDNVDPFIRCNNYQVNLYEDGSNVITWQMVIDSVWDNCDSELLSYHLTQDTFTCSDAGMNIINVTATNTDGDFVTCEASVTVLDMMDPKIVCTEGVEVDLWGNGEYVMDATSLAALTSGSWDNCTDITDSLKYSLGTYSFDCSNIETLQALVEVTATDENGNSSTAYCPVTVYDVTDPVASCVDTFEIILDDNGNGIIFPGDINETGASYDVCGIATMELSQTTVGCSDLGFVPVTLSVYDPSGNSDKCTSLIEVIDDIAPELTPVSDIVLTVVPPACEANLGALLPMLVATDPCLDSIWITNGVDLNGAFPLGATEVIWAAADLAGNTNQDTFTIKVGAYNAAPTIDAINDQFVEEDSGLLVVPISGISTGNDCPAVEQSIVSVEALSNNTALITDITVEHTLGAGRIELTLVPDMSGTATIAVTVIDDGGTTNGWINTTIETFEVTVAPVTDAPILVDSIADQEINADKVLKLPISPALGEVFDDEDDPVLTISVTMEDGSTLPDFAEYINDTLTVTPFRENMGCYEIMVTATDSSGATATDQFQLCVLDWITGTDEFVNLAKAQLYPNPTEGMVTLEISGNHSSEVEVVVMNILGKEVLKKDFHTTELLQIDMSEHVSGMYIVKLIVDGNEIVKKLILDPK